MTLLLRRSLVPILVLLASWSLLVWSRQVFFDLRPWQEGAWGQIRTGHHFGIAYRLGDDRLQAAVSEALHGDREEEGSEAEIHYRNGGDYQQKQWISSVRELDTDRSFLLAIPRRSGCFYSRIYLDYDAETGQVLVLQRINVIIYLRL